MHVKLQQVVVLTFTQHPVEKMQPPWVGNPGRAHIKAGNCYSNNSYKNNSYQNNSSLIKDLNEGYWFHMGAKSIIIGA